MHAPVYGGELRWRSRYRKCPLWWIAGSRSWRPALESLRCTGTSTSCCEAFFDEDSGRGTTPKTWPRKIYLRTARHPDLDQVQCLKAFAFQTALNLVRDRSRRSYTRSQRMSISIERVELTGGDDPLDQATHDEGLELVVRALSQLPDSTRRALLLHRIEGLRYSDIAKNLGVSVSMVEKHISAALAVLRELLGVSSNLRTCGPTR